MFPQLKYSFPSHSLSPYQSITASTPSSLMHKQVMAKQLGELLREQQEPFILEIYLHEKGYLKKSGSWGPKSKRREVIPGCSNIVTAVVNKLVESFRNSRKAKNSASADGNHSDQEIGRRSSSERLSSYSGTTVFHSCSGSDTEGRTGSPQADCVLPFKISNLEEASETDTDRRLPWRCREENTEELSPVSELETAPSHENSQVQNKSQRNAKTKDSMLATPFCKLVFKSPIHELSSNNTPPQHLTGKRVLQESKQLLFDCMRELVETQGSEGGRGKEYLAILGPAEIWKILGEDTRTWNKLSGNETNTTQLMHLDFAASAKTWKGFRTEMREIGVVIGDAILEDLCAEIAVDMILN